VALTARASSCSPAVLRPIKMPEALRQRDFRMLLSAQAVSVLGDRIVAVALAFAVLEVGGSVADVGIVLASGTLPLVAALLIGGVVADRASRRKVMLTADLARMVTQGTMAILLLTGSAEVWMLAGLAAGTGAATGFFNPASTGLLPAVVSGDHLQQANGLRMFAISVGEIFGPLTAGILVATSGAGGAIAIDAATFAVSAMFLVRLRVKEQAAGTTTTFVAELLGGWSAFKARTWVWTFVAAVAVTNLVWGAWGVLGPITADRSLGGAEAWGIILTAMGVGALAGSVVATRAQPRRPMLMVTLATGVFGLPLAFLATTASVPALAVAAAVSGGAVMFANAVWESTLQRHVPHASLSRVSAYTWFGSMAFYPLGLALWGPIAAATGFQTALWLAFSLQILTTIALLMTPAIRRLQAPPRRSHPGPDLPAAT
jgi:MFS family permease